MVRESRQNPIKENEANESDKISKMDTTEIKEAEVRQALKTKTGRTPGINHIPAELYKADGDVAGKELMRLFNEVWHEEKVPDQ